LSALVPKDQEPKLLKEGVQSFVNLHKPRC